VSPIPTLGVGAMSLGHAKDVVGAIYDVGGSHPLRIDLRDTPPFGIVIGPDLPSPPDPELIARYLYLNAVLDQARDSVGIHLLLSRVMHSMHSALGLSVLQDPLEFFKNLETVIPLIDSTHDDVRAERAPLFPTLTYYSLYDQYRVTPWVAFRWGTPLINILRFDRQMGGVLNWLNTFPSGETAAIAVKSDKLFGLGAAIGEKASRLLVKWITFTASIPTAWYPNSYEVPLDANVGRVLMRTGYLFAFLDEADMQKGTTKPWTLQSNGRVNLSAQSLNQRPLRRTDQIQGSLNRLLASWGLNKSKSNYRIMKTLNVLLADARGTDAAIGQVDDGFMRIGRDFCFNTDPNCAECPLANVCLANNQEPLLKTTFYCGTGSGVFF
jgi:hypothetical protein